MDPSFDPDRVARRREDDELQNQSSGRWNRAQRRSAFEPNVRIQLVTTSAGEKLGGIRLSTWRPPVHAPIEECTKACNKVKWGRAAPCRKQACMRDGYNEVDKLKKSIEYHTRKLN